MGNFGLFPYTGSKMSPQAKTNYDGNEKKHAFITKTMAKAIALFAVIMLSQSAIGPVFYAFFDYPQPQQWNLPIQYQWVPTQQKTNSARILPARVSTFFTVFCVFFFSSIFGSDWSTFYMELVANVYLRFYIDWIVEIDIYLVYFTIHMTSVAIFIGLCFSIRAMRIDLKMQMQEIGDGVGNRTTIHGRKIGCRLVKEIQFHSQIIK